MSRTWLLFNFFLACLLFFLLGAATVFYVKDKYDISLLIKNRGQQNQKKAAQPSKGVDWQKIQKEVLPEEGYKLDVAFEGLGPKLIKIGAIDPLKMEQNFQSDGGLTPEQKTILTQNTDTHISINQKNATFMVDFFWALGLVNKNDILDSGPMVADRKQLASFASTAGWTLGKKPAVNLFSKYEIINLTKEQQDVVKEVAQNVYRPCCGNPTSLPDCNHGMATLGLTEYLASKGKTANEIYKDILYFNSFWFPQNYMDVAAYFKLTGNNWSNMSPQTILAAQFSSGQGYARIKQELDTKLGVPQPAGGPGRGCGA